MFLRTRPDNYMTSSRPAIQSVLHPLISNMFIFDRIHIKNQMFLQCNNYSRIAIWSFPHALSVHMKRLPADVCITFKIKRQWGGIKTIQLTHRNRKGIEKQVVSNYTEINLIFLKHQCNFVILFSIRKLGYILNM